MAGHPLTNRIANPVLRRLLRGPLGRRPGRRLAVLRYTGRRSGEAHELVCQYVRSGSVVWILVGRAEGKTWWRNLREPAGVDLWLAGVQVRASAVTLRGSDHPTEVAEGLRTYLSGMPAARRAVGLAPGTAVDDVAPATTMVRADIAD